MEEVREVTFLDHEHAEGIRALCMEPDVAAVAGVNTSSMDTVNDYIATAKLAQDEGQSFVFVLTRGSEVMGICRLIGVRGVPRLIVGVGSQYRGQGNGSFLVRHVLDYAFGKLHLDLVTAAGPCLRLVSQFGTLSGQGLTREDWQAGKTSQARAN